MKYGEIIDISFPVVDPQEDEEYINRLAEQYFQQIFSLHPRAVLCQGEFCLSYLVITKLRERGIKVLAACSARIVKEKEQKKEVVFSFQRFRQYGCAESREIHCADLG